MSDKQRVIQEYVPGKQITLAHIIPNPMPGIHERLGLEGKGAIGIMTITPSEAAIIAADTAAKSGLVEIGFLDRFTGSVVITGDIAGVESSLKAVIQVLRDTLKFTSTEITQS